MNSITVGPPEADTTYDGSVRLQADQELTLREGAETRNGFAWRARTEQRGAGAGTDASLNPTPRRRAAKRKRQQREDGAQKGGKRGRGKLRNRLRTRLSQS
jgi:hypothetical protein